MDFSYFLFGIRFYDILYMKPLDFGFTVIFLNAAFSWKIVDVMDT